MQALLSRESWEPWKELQTGLRSWTWPVAKCTSGTVPPMRSCGIPLLALTLGMCSDYRSWIALASGSVTITLGNPPWLSANVPAKFEVHITMQSTPILMEAFNDALNQWAWRAERFKCLTQTWSCKSDLAKSSLQTSKRHWCMFSERCSPLRSKAANLSEFQGGTQSVSASQQKDDAEERARAVEGAVPASAPASTSRADPPQSFSQWALQLQQQIQAAMGSRVKTEAVDPWHQLAIEIDCRVRDCAALEKVPCSVHPLEEV